MNWLRGITRSATISRIQNSHKGEPDRERPYTTSNPVEPQDTATVAIAGGYLSQNEGGGDRGHGDRDEACLVDQSGLRLVMHLPLTPSYSRSNAGDKQTEET